MRSVKTHFGVICSLIALLFSVQLGFLVNNLAASYEKSIQNEYNIVIVSKSEISLEKAKEKVSEISTLTRLGTSGITSRLKGKISDSAYEKLNQNLPIFYSVKLEKFPDASELSQIEKNLNQIENVTRVEIFKKTHDDIFKFLLLIKSLVYGFIFLIVLLGVTLIYKQMRIWVYEHKERIEIMDLFGASFFIKSAKLYKMAIVDSIISALCVTLFYMFLPKWELFSNTLDSIANLNQAIVLPFEGLFLLCLALVLSVIAVTLVMIQIGRSK